MKVTNAYLNEKLSINNNKPLKEGLFIRAKVAEINGDDITIVLENGEILDAKTNIDLENMKNSLLTFLIKSVQDNKIFLLPIDEGSLLISNIENGDAENKVELFINKVLDDYNLPKNKENVQIVRTMLSFKIPLTQENVTKVIKNLDKINNLKNVQREDKIITFNSGRSPLNENIMKLIKVDSSTDIIRHSYNSEASHNSFSDLTNIVVQNNSTGNMKFIDVTEIVYSKLESIFPEHNTSTDTINKLVCLMNLDIEISIENIEILTNLLNKGEGITKPLFELFSYLKNHSRSDNIFSSENIDLFNKIKFKPLKVNYENNFNKENVKLFLNEINDLWEQIKSSIINKKNIIKELNIKLDDFFQSIELHNKINSYYSFVNIPIEFNEEKDNSHITILKKKNKLKKNSYVFYISLNTKNLKKVDILCNINYEEIKLDFIVEKEFVSYFTRKLKHLRKSLVNLGYQNIEINFKEDKESDLLSMFIDEDLFLNYNLNIRV